MLIRAVEFITTADQAPSSNELQLTRRLFSMLLHGLSSSPERKNHWGNAWLSRPALKKNTARIMVWLLGPHQSNNMRVFAVRSLMEEPRGRDILSSLLEIHPQVHLYRITFMSCRIYVRTSLSLSIIAIAGRTEIYGIFLGSVATTRRDAKRGCESLR